MQKIVFIIEKITKIPQVPSSAAGKVSPLYNIVTPLGLYSWIAVGMSDFFEYFNFATII